MLIILEQELETDLGMPSDLEKLSIDQINKLLSSLLNHEWIRNATNETWFKILGKFIYTFYGKELFSQQEVVAIAQTIFLLINEVINEITSQNTEGENDCSIERCFDDLCRFASLIARSVDNLENIKDYMGEIPIDIPNYIKAILVKYELLDPKQYVLPDPEETVEGNNHNEEECEPDKFSSILKTSINKLNEYFACIYREREYYSDYLLPSQQTLALFLILMKAMRKQPS